jgi:hypothetical protein
VTDGKVILWPFKGSVTVAGLMVDALKLYLEASYLTPPISGTAAVRLG